VSAAALATVRNRGTLDGQQLPANRGLEGAQRRHRCTCSLSGTPGSGGIAVRGGIGITIRLTQPVGWPARAA
jgi:hypothetical protein